MKTVKISISVEGEPTVEATVSPDAVTSCEAFIAEQAPKYSGIADLFIRHFRDSLAVPMVQRYSAEVIAAQEAATAAQKAADDAAASAAAGTVVIK